VDISVRLQMSEGFAFALSMPVYSHAPPRGVTPPAGGGMGYFLLDFLALAFFVGRAFFFC
jgi:hypothetical protein